ncbi:MAG TPA: COX15/CtaA family protein [Opitutaceae bacterium]|nr:COX15/CtaA family protein [Opitutaceae bacterium]
MPGILHADRRSAYQPALAWFAAVGAAWVFVLVMLGAFTTSIGAGMAFPDWPLSNGSLNPAGWLQNVALFAEHSHRLSAAIMSTITIALAAWLWRCEQRRWLRRLGGFAVALVLFQAVVGGLRVLLDREQLAAVDTSVGRLFAILHAGLAQVFVCTLIAIAAALSRPWVEGAAWPAARGLRRLGAACCGLLLGQLAIAAVMRHSFAGLAIPTFPLTPEGGLVPAHWDFRISINFAHRAMALVLAAALLWYAAAVWSGRGAGAGRRGLAALMVGLLAAQIALGAMVVWTGRNAYLTTAHVLVGALALATTFLLTWTLHRDDLEAATTRRRPPVPTNAAASHLPVHA